MVQREMRATNFIGIETSHFVCSQFKEFIDFLDQFGLQPHIFTSGASETCQNS